jgi:hypothetical protein
VFEYRVTKYDPARRDARGAYTRKEWTSFGDIGRTFGGQILTLGEYRRVEDAYVSAALAFLREAGVETLTVEGLEARGRPRPVAAEDSRGLAEMPEVIRRVLREEYWCRLESPEAFVHIGYDYAMYIGVPRACPEAERSARRPGLYAEAFRSPYGRLDVCSKTLATKKVTYQPDAPASQSMVADDGNSLAGASGSYRDATIDVDAIDP